MAEDGNINVCGKIRYLATFNLVSARSYTVGKDTCGHLFQINLHEEHCLSRKQGWNLKDLVN